MLINWSHIQELHDDIGTEEFHEVLELFLDELESDIMRLEQLCTTQRANTFYMLKGGARNLGMVDLANHCHACELGLRAGGPQPIASSTIAEVYARAKNELMSNLGGLGRSSGAVA